MRNRLKEPRPTNRERHIAPLLDLRFRRLLTPEQWSALPKPVRARFSKRIEGDKASVYCGVVTHTRMNLVGKILANTLRLIGAPLPIDTQNDGAPAIVTVTEDPASQGQFWLRQYGRPKGFPQTIHSAKRFQGPTGLEEYIGFGIGMTLTLDVEDSGLWFKSARYFIGQGKIRVYLPRWLTPGHLRVGHMDAGNGQFDFTLNLKHPFLGVLLDQKIRFADEGTL